MDYADFVLGKSQVCGNHGFDPAALPDFLFPFQRDLVEWALRKGRAAIFADCGMGKTPMQLVWADKVAHETQRPVLILTPLAVSAQTIREADKFGIAAERAEDGKFSSSAHIVVTNYERLHYLDSCDFAGVVCDESSILKNFSGARKAEVTEFMREMPYRLLCTATASPNDFIELGTSSEALGYLGYMDMLGMFFKNDQNNSSTGRQWGSESKWRFKQHAETDFWRWVCGWARAARRPSDLGHDDNGFILPRLIEREHMIRATTARDGLLFDLPAVTLQEQREERRRTLPERCDMVAQLVDTDASAVVWCHLNDEADRLAEIVPGAVQVSGSDSDNAKESKFLAFSEGDIRVLVTKPRIGAFGLNWQHCAHMTFFPSHSFEQYYQGVRRCWRFGQPSEVVVDIVTSEGEAGVLRNLQRKADQADRMFDSVVALMHDAMDTVELESYEKEVELPAWL